MIVLYRQAESPTADEIQEELKRLVLAHRVEEVDGSLPMDLPRDADLPLLVEGDDVYSGEAVRQFLEKRSRRLRISRRVSADACYLDPDDPSQCI